MRFPFSLPWRRPADGRAVPERKTAAGGFMAVAAQGGQAFWTGRSYAALAREGFMRNPIAHRAARMVAEASASVSWLLYDGDEEIGDHPLLALLGKPSAHMGGPDFFETLYGHLMLAGNAYIEPLVVGERLRELHLLRPDRVSIIEGEDGWPLGYDYRAEGRAIRRIAAERDGLGLLHLKLFHPLDDRAGFAPLASAGAALDLHNAASQWNKRLLDNSARPSGALVYQPKEGGNLSTEQYERLKRELEEGYQGAMNAGRPLLLEGGLDWKAMGLSPRDMDFLEARNGAARDIALALGVPPMLIGIPGDNTYANYQEANRAFYRLTVLPLVNRTAARLCGWLSPIFGSGLRLEPDLDRIAGLAGERDALWTRIGAASFLTDEEKREAVGY
ncbi:phage portal protein [Agrobacterium tumefaciens]|uniref:phage portal protein n=1 Tax=Agrobacterium TaxID=357 RepID=UPI000DD003F8|nr:MULTISPECIES: phage portal protein [Agrobacterium]NSY42540.1 phage portal protein [Agrobacterium tumefaciens]NSZ83368.1 phage portal protein [Agrobacterium tumefaciens]WCA69583.1 phage portal protein [Agrobacterium tumefaciens]